jgi:N-acetyl-gamma-glutamylphosphate reductase
MVVVRADNLKSGHSTQCIQCAYDNRKTRRKGLKTF